MLTCEDYVPEKVLSAWFQHQPINGRGDPQTQLDLRILRYLKDRSSEFVAVADLAFAVDAHPEQARYTCGFLEACEILISNPDGSQSYKWNAAARPDLAPQLIQACEAHWSQDARLPKAPPETRPFPFEFIVRRSRENRRAS